MRTTHSQVASVVQELDKHDVQRNVEGEQCVWIIKASSSSKGVGIKLIDSLKQVILACMYLAFMWI